MAYGLDKTERLRVQSLLRSVGPATDTRLNPSLVHEFDIPGALQFDPGFFPGFFSEIPPENPDPP